MSTITLALGAVTLALPSALKWSDEFTWSPIEQAQTYTNTGALLIEEAVKQTGKPYTLEGEDDKAWCTRELVNTLKAWAATPGVQMVLTLRGVARPVTFNHVKGALEGLPVLFYEDGSIADADWYVPTIRLIGI